ncbi:GntR family transcriptional regulator [Kitasatospora sp. MY 5-36]|uniref:GntR family transcriptional regulator n=1 Tax=Kitasatospora sp. MY 5-36 TaxID=1678027 RepID=UPI0007C72687|nr:GntR family transcriptional regulator [Kitasatospora sp. MY 5-36]
MTEPTDAAAAAYRRVADHIRSGIRAGDDGFTPGSRLPSLQNLAKQYDVPRSIIDRAVRSLAAEGLVISEQGRGSFVSRFVRKITRDGTSRYRRVAREQDVGGGRQSRGAFETELRGMGLVPESRVTVERAQPTAVAAQALDVDAAAVSTVLRSRVMYAVPQDDPSARPIPVQVADTFLPLDIAGDTQLEDIDTGPGGSISRLADLGFAQTHIEETINVRPPSAAEAQSLNLSDQQPVYELLHVARTRAGRAVEATVHIMPVHLWTLRYDWALDPTT